MKLYLIYASPEIFIDYDMYDSAVVAAESEEAAARTHPGGGNLQWNKSKLSWWDWDDGDWVPVDRVNVTYLAEYDGPAGVICASFNAG